MDPSFQRETVFAGPPRPHLAPYLAPRPDLPPAPLPVRQPFRQALWSGPARSLRGLGLALCLGACLACSSNPEPESGPGAASEAMPAVAPEADEPGQSGVVSETGTEPAGETGVESGEEPETQAEPTAAAKRKAKREQRAAERRERREAGKVELDLEGPPEPSPCRRQAMPEAWLDRTRWGVFVGVCESGRWIDGFFGSTEANDDENLAYGRLGLGILWDEADDPRIKGRLRAKVPLPRLERRWNAFVGRYEEEELVSDRSDDFGASVPGLFRRSTDRLWLAGLGYSPLRSARSRLDIDGGVDVDFPLDPFVRARYRRFLIVGDRSVTRLRQSLFWRREKGWGTTTRIDVERLLGLRYHVRWRSTGTFAEQTEGVDWSSAVTFYHFLAERRAMAWEIEAKGDTDALVPLERYGFRAIYRQRWRRDWLFFEVEGRVFWPRRDIYERSLPDDMMDPGPVITVDPNNIDDEAHFGVGFGIELVFGKHPWMGMRHDPG